MSSLGDLLPGLASQPVAPPATPPVKPQPAAQAPGAPVRVGTGVQSAKLIFGPKPAYPILAKTTRTQGTVRIVSAGAKMRIVPVEK
jgi:hypothetical protein